MPLNINLEKKRQIIILVLFSLVSITWGTTWIAMKIAVETIPPMFATGMRFILSSPIIILIAWLTKAPLMFPVGLRKFQLAVCVFYFGIPFTLMIYGEVYVDSGLASIIFANMPVAILITSIIFINERVSILQVIGLAIALISLSSILLYDSSISAENSWLGICSLVLAVIIHSIMYVKCKKISKKISVSTFNALPSFVAGIILIVVGISFENPTPADFSIKSMLSILYLGVFAGVCGILSYFELQKRVSSFHASIVFLVFPIIAISIEGYVYDKAITPNLAMLVASLLFGVFLILKYQKKQARML